MGRFRVTYETTFAAAHNLRMYHGAPEPLHGHNWRVQVCLAGSELDDEDMLVDFKEVEEKVEGVLGEYRDGYVNEVAPFDDLNPTSENLARVIYRRVARAMPTRRVRVEGVTVWETAACGVTYSE